MNRYRWVFFKLILGNFFNNWIWINWVKLDALIMSRWPSNTIRNWILIMQDYNNHKHTRARPRTHSHTRTNRSCQIIYSENYTIRKVDLERKFKNIGKSDWNKLLYMPNKYGSTSFRIGVRQTNSKSSNILHWKRRSRTAGWSLTNLYPLLIYKHMQTNAFLN